MKQQPRTQQQALKNTQQVNGIAMERSITMKQIKIALQALLGLLLLTGMNQAQAAMEMYFIHNDHLGTPQVVTDQNQVVVWEGRQKPFGEVEVTTSILDNDSRFPGQYLDKESGLHYNYFRDYDPSIGRYIQSDPIGLEGGINTYAYVSGNPLRYIDPNGLCAMLIAVGSSAASQVCESVPEGGGATGGGEELCKKIGYQGCKQIAKNCQLSCGIRGAGTLCTYPCQVTHSECRNEVDATCKPKEPAQCDGNYPIPAPNPDPLTPNCTFERWQAGLCGS